MIEKLAGKGYFIAKLLGSGNYVLVHPMEEGGERFLPCCYGYATTIRRAQGASLSMGCIYFDQKKYPVGRGYGYVAVSRFRSRGGVYLYGHKRRTDFLPVGGSGDEVLERGYESNSDEDPENDNEYPDFDCRTGNSAYHLSFDPEAVAGSITQEDHVDEFSQ